MNVLSYNPANNELEQAIVDDNNTHYADAPLDGNKAKVVINQTVIQQVPRTTLEIKSWRSAHIAAESRYFPNRSWLYNLYDDALLDGHLTGIIGKRIDAILNKSLYFERGEQRVPELDKLITCIEFRNVMAWILEAQLWGISGVEFEPGAKFAPKPIPRKHIKPKWQVISMYESGKDGISYAGASNLLIIGEPENLGILLKCVPYVIYKRNNTGDWAQYIEIFGQPIRVMYYDAYDQQAKLELKETLDNSGGSLALMIPKGVEFDIKDGKVTNGDGRLQDTFKDFLNEEMSVLVLGNTETTTHNGTTGTGGKSKVHAQQQNEIQRSDLNYLTSWLNSDKFLSILASYGYPVEGGQFKFTQDINVEQQAQQIDIDVKLYTQLGLPLDHGQLYDYYGRNKPKDYDAQIAEMKTRKIQPEATALEDSPPDPVKREKKKPATNPSARTLPRKVTPSKWRNLLAAFHDFFGQARS